VDEFWEYTLDACPCCQGKLQIRPLEDPRIQQQVELAKRLVTVSQHEVVGQWCARCKSAVVAPWPEELRKAGLVGPDLTALVGFLKGACHMSFSNIRKFFRDVINFQLSRGQLAKLVQKVSKALKDPFEELLALLPEQDQVNVDETGHKENGSRLWTWCFRATLFTVYKISPSRGSDVLLEVLGKEFNGLLGCDYFSAYRKYARLNENVLLQFCLAHYIRDVKFLVEHPQPQNQEHGKRLVIRLRGLFSVIHRREEYASEATFLRALERARNELVYDATLEAPDTAEAQTLAKRFYRYADEYFRFIANPSMEPTNNVAERAIRFVAIHRRMTQGTRGEAGQRWVERMASILATCEQQARSFFGFLRQAVASMFQGEEAPSLVPGANNSS
jgi:transposase